MKQRDDTILVELPKAFPVARLADIAKEYGYIYRWSIHNDIMRTPRHLEIYRAGTRQDKGVGPDTGEQT